MTVGETSFKRQIETMLLQAACKRVYNASKGFSNVPHTSYTLTCLQSSSITFLLRGFCCASRLHSQRLHPTNDAFSASLPHPVMSCLFHVIVVPSFRPRSLGVTHLNPIACYAPLAAPLALTSQPLHSANNGVLHSRGFLRASRCLHPHLPWCTGI